jgi:KipI family sensor histidine kinase inhibitor
MQVHAVGEAVWVLQPAAPAPPDLPLQRRLWAAAQALRQAWPQAEVVPGMNNLSLRFDPDACEAQEARQRLWQAWEAAQHACPEPRERRLPVQYGGEWGPDLAEVARHHGLSPQAVVDMHSQACYTVFFLGFQPGFAYLGGLPEALHTPRRASPRLQVRAGSVGIGGAQTGVYPLSSPGGWNLIGHTSAPLFNAQASTPCLLAPGDTVRFEVEALHA